MELQCLKIKLKEGTLERVKEWCANFQNHPDIGYVLDKETIRIETLLLDNQEDGDYLIFYMRADSLQNANDFLIKEQHPLNDLSKQFMQECWDLENIKVLEPVLDLENLSS